MYASENFNILQPHFTPVGGKCVAALFVWSQFKVSVLLVSPLNNNPELNLNPTPAYP